MEIIPAIDLLEGACVRLHQGDYDQVTRFSDDPVAQARSWQAQGATRLHLVDLDGAGRGEPVNDAVVRAITAGLDIPVQLGGGVRSLERAEDLLACGLDRVILGTVAIEQPQLVTNWPGVIPAGSSWHRCEARPGGHPRLDRAERRLATELAQQLSEPPPRSSPPTSPPMAPWPGRICRPCVPWPRPVVCR